MSEFYIGLMSGTSLDAIDAVVVDLSSSQPTLVHAANVPFDAALREECLAFISTVEQRDAGQLGELDRALGEAFASAVMTLIEAGDIDAATVTAIGSHGQTVLHQPDGTHPFTLQIGDPNRIASQTGITTVADFRRRDMAVGGQGAPLAPAFHNAVFRDREEERVVLNIGGMANVTRLPASAETPVTGFDTGPGNVLLDSWYRQHHRDAFDRDGEWSARGKVDHALLDTMLAEEYFQIAPPKSTGRERFNGEWLNTRLSQAATRSSAQDIQTTLCELTATSIARAIQEYAPASGRVLVCGGGAHNTDLMARLQRLLADIPVEATDEHGIPSDWVEAMAFAWLAKQTLEGKPGNIPSVTGAREAVVLGAIYPA